MKVRRKDRVWIAATVEHDGGDIALVSIAERGDLVERKFWVDVRARDKRTECPEGPQFSGWCGHCGTKHNEG